MTNLTEDSLCGYLFASVAKTIENLQTEVRSRTLKLTNTAVSQRSDCKLEWPYRVTDDFNPIRLIDDNDFSVSRV